MNVAVDSLLSLSSVERFSTPFDYFVSPHALKGDLSTRVLDWFETEAPWTLVETDFYEQYEFSLWDVELPPPLLVLREPRLLDQLKSKVGDQFKAELGNDIDVAAHKLVPGQRIRIHNDFISGQKTYRLIIQLNRVWRDEDGGRYHQRVCKKVKAMYPFCSNQQRTGWQAREKGAHRHERAKHRRG